MSINKVYKEVKLYILMHVLYNNFLYKNIDF